MALGVPGNSDAKVVTMLLFNIFDQVHRTIEVTVGCPLLLCPRWLATKCKDVSYAIFLGSLEGIVDDIFVGVCAS